MKKEYSLKGKVSFSQVFQLGKRYKFSNISFLVLQKIGTQPVDSIKVGITISRKFGNAVQRNRMKRRIKSIFDGYLDKFEESAWIVINPYKESENLEFDELDSVINILLKKSGLLAK